MADEKTDALDEFIAEMGREAKAIKDAQAQADVARRMQAEQDAKRAALVEAETNRVRGIGWSVVQRVALGMRNSGLEATEKKEPDQVGPSPIAHLGTIVLGAPPNSRAPGVQLGARVTTRVLPNGETEAFSVALAFVSMDTKSNSGGKKAFREVAQTKEASEVELRSLLLKALEHATGKKS